MIEAVERQRTELARFLSPRSRSSSPRRRASSCWRATGPKAGYATLGRIGFEGRYDYGALGPVMNLASRLSDRAEPGQVLIGQRLFVAVEEQVDAAPVGALELKGLGRPIPAYEVRGLRA